MAYTTGRCMNDLYCAAASGRQLLQIPMGNQFVCPQCGKPLAEPASERRAISSPVMLICCGLVAAGGALFAIGSVIGPPAPAAAGRPGPAPAGLANVAAPGAPMHTDDVAVETAVPPAAASAAPGYGALSETAKETPLPRGSIARANISGEPGSEVPPATIRLAMMQRPAKDEARPTPTPAPALVQRPSPAVVQRLSQGASAPPVHAPAPAPAQTQLQAQALEHATLAKQARAAESARRAKAAQQADQQKMLAQQAEDERSRVETQHIEAQAEEAANQRLEAARAEQAALEARQRQAAEARKIAVAAALPKGPTRGFSPHVVAGGAPGYPADFESEGRIGHVTVSCLITQNGTPRGCHVMSSQGGAAFDRSVLGWLGSGQVRFAPILHDGAPQAEEHSWTMNFEP